MLTEIKPKFICFSVAENKLHTQNWIFLNYPSVGIKHFINISRFKNKMIDESIKIKLNQFMLAYERQCVELEFQKQNIKQNVMLSIIENKNAKKTSLSTINNSLEKSMTRSKIHQNLASSKQSKFSEKNYDEKNQQQQKYEQKTQRSRKSGLYQGDAVVGPNKKLDNFFQNDNKKMIESQLKEQDNLVESSISRRNQRRVQKETQQGFSAGESQSGVFGKRSLLSSKVYGQSQKVIGKQSNPSLLQRQQQHSQQQITLHQQQQTALENYPTFKKPSFQFITNLSQLRRSNPHEQQQQQQMQDLKEQQEQANDYRQYYKQQTRAHKKWNSSPSRNKEWGQEREGEGEQQYDDDQQYRQQTYSDNDNFSRSQQSIISKTHNNPSSVISNMKQDQSLLLPSQFKQKPTQQPTRKSYLAFQINMQKSNLPNNQNIEQLKKKKILQLERKRMQRIQNNSRKKLNPSEVNTPTSRQYEKQLSSPVIGSTSSRQKSQRKETENNRDSLNKSINERKQQRAKFMKTTNSSYREEEIAHKESMFQDNRTTMTKYGDDSSRMGSNNNNNRSVSPLNTVKTTHMQNTIDKRPPLNKNRRQQNIFAAQSPSPFTRQKLQPSYHQNRQRSTHKVSDPKIIPIDRKNSFQKKSNIKLMANAITYTCLPGELNRRQREKLIDILDDYESEFFIFLFKEYSRKVIKGIYILENTHDRIVKIYGEKAPLQIFPEQIHEFYRFDSGSREFKKIDGCRSFSYSVHAVDLK